MHRENEKDGQFKPKNLVVLKQIIQRDYGVDLSDEEAEAFGLSLLKITRLAMGAFNRAEEKRSMASNQL